MSNHVKIAGARTLNELGEHDDSESKHSQSIFIVTRERLATLSPKKAAMNTAGQSGYSAGRQLVHRVRSMQRPKINEAESDRSITWRDSQIPASCEVGCFTEDIELYLTREVQNTKYSPGVRDSEIPSQLGSTSEPPHKRLGDIKIGYVSPNSSTLTSTFHSSNHHPFPPPSPPSHTLPTPPLLPHNHGPQTHPPNLPPRLNPPNPQTPLLLLHHGLQHLPPLQTLFLLIS